MFAGPRLRLPPISQFSYNSIFDLKDFNMVPKSIRVRVVPRLDIERVNRVAKNKSTDYKRQRQT